MCSIASRSPADDAAGTFASFWIRLREAALAREAAQAPLQVGRDERDPDGDRDHHAAGDRGRERQRDRVGTAEQPVVQPEAAHDHGHGVWEVGQHEERDRLVGDGALAHARAPQRPRGDHQAAGAAGREQPRRRQPGERDLVARRPADPLGRAAVDAAEHHDVAEVHAAGEEQRGDRPRRAAVLDPAPGLVEAGELGHQEVERGEREQQEGGDADQPARGDLERRALLVVVVVVRRLRIDLRVRSRRGHARARASRAWTAADTRISSGRAAGVARRMPSVSARPAARSVT